MDNSTSSQLHPPKSIMEFFLVKWVQGNVSLRNCANGPGCCRFCECTTAEYQCAHGPQLLRDCTLTGNSGRNSVWSVTLEVLCYVEKGTVEIILHSAQTMQIEYKWQNQHRQAYGPAIIPNGSLTVYIYANQTYLTLPSLAIPFFQCLIMAYFYLWVQTLLYSHKIYLIRAVSLVSLRLL